MNFVLILVCILTFVIHFISISSLAARIVATRTKRIASSISLFNIIILMSQVANTIQAPLLTKSVESDIVSGFPPNILVFRCVLLFAFLGSMAGAFSIPTVHRFMAKGVESLYRNNSVFNVVLKSLKPSTLLEFKKSLKIPSKHNFLRLSKFKDLRVGIIFLNIGVACFSSISVLSCLYAGYLEPALRTTSLSLSGIASGVGAFGMMLLIEPYNAILTDKVIDGSISHAYFRRHLTFVIIARVIGVFLSQFLLIPIAHLIALVSSVL